MQLDIGGFLTSFEFLSAIAGAVTLFISAIITDIIGGFFSGTA